jgi:hypothetical protein
MSTVRRLAKKRAGSVPRSISFSVYWLKSWRLQTKDAHKINRKRNEPYEDRRLQPHLS